MLFTALTRSSIAIVCCAMLLAGCAQMPRGQARLDLVDQLVLKQEFAKANRLLENIDVSDPAFEELQLRRRAMRPLIAQFEANILERAKALQTKDEWPAALALIDGAIAKLPGSPVLAEAKQQFFSERQARLDAIGRELDLLQARHLAAKTEHVEMSLAVHPRGWKTRWQAYRHQAQTDELATELVQCGDLAMAQQDFELALSCFNMAEGINSELDLGAKIAEVNAGQAAAKRKALAMKSQREQQRKVSEAEQVVELKGRYLQLIAAGWWLPARDTLAELNRLAAQDPDVRAWNTQLEQTLSRKVSQGIRQGQSLYSRGYLREALAIWRDTQALAPEHVELQGHIARVERFIDKLDRLDRSDS